MKFNKVKCRVLPWESGGRQAVAGAAWLGSSTAGKALVDSELSVSRRRALAAKMTNSVLGCVNRSTAKRLRDLITPLCSVLVSSQLEHCVQFWDPQFKKNIGKLD